MHGSQTPLDKGEEMVVEAGANAITNAAHALGMAKCASAGEHGMFLGMCPQQLGRRHTDPHILQSNALVLSDTIDASLKSAPYQAFHSSYTGRAAMRSLFAAHIADQY